MAVRGWGLISLYIYIRHFKNSFCQKPLDQFQYNSRIVPLVILFHYSVQAIMMDEKNMATGVQGYKIYTKILEQ